MVIEKERRKKKVLGHPRSTAGTSQGAVGQGQEERVREGEGVRQREREPSGHRDTSGLTTKYREAAGQGVAARKRDRPYHTANRWTEARDGPAAESASASLPTREQAELEEGQNEHYRKEQVRDGRPVADLVLAEALLVHVQYQREA